METMIKDFLGFIQNYPAVLGIVSIGIFFVFKYTHSHFFSRYVANVFEPFPGYENNHVADRYSSYMHYKWKYQVYFILACVSFIALLFTKDISTIWCLVFTIIISLIEFLDNRKVYYEGEKAFEVFEKEEIETYIRMKEQYYTNLPSNDNK